jgi:hypothetical protein
LSTINQSCRSRLPKMPFQISAISCAIIDGIANNFEFNERR